MSNRNVVRVCVVTLRRVFEQLWVRHQRLNWRADGLKYLSQKWFLVYGWNRFRRLDKFVLTIVTTHFPKSFISIILLWWCICMALLFRTKTFVYCIHSTNGKYSRIISSPLMPRCLHKCCYVFNSMNRIIFLQTLGYFIVMQFKISWV